MSRRRIVAVLGAAGAGVGAALTATAASLCCVGPVVAPLVVALLGAGGAAWAAGLKPYSPYLLIASGLLLGYAFRSIYGREAACEVGEGPPRGRRGVTRIVVWVAWFAAAVWLLALGLNLFLS